MVTPLEPVDAEMDVLRFWDYVLEVGRGTLMVPHFFY